MNALRSLLDLAGQEADKQTVDPQLSGYARFEHRSSQKGSVDLATLKTAMSKLPLEAWPDVVETVQGSTSGKLRIDMLAGFEWWRTDLKSPVDQRIDSAAHVRNCATAPAARRLSSFSFMVGKASLPRASR